MTQRNSAVLAILLAVPLALAAQDRLKTMPGYEAARRVARETAAIAGGVTGVTWISDRVFEYEQSGKHYRFDVTRGASEADDTSTPRERRSSGSTAALPDRGRQFESTTSPDGRLKAYYKDRNVWISDADDQNARALTTDGSASPAARPIMPPSFCHPIDFST